MPQVSTKSPYQRHVDRWKGCDKCPLHEHRNRVALVRGTLPCDVLFVGEAPGASENMLGTPFVGPAGKLLDQIILRAVESYLCGSYMAIYNKQTSGPSMAFTNLVACIPLDSEGSAKVAEPPRESIEACAPRLAELVAMAKPSLIVAVGALAAKWLPKTKGVSIFGEKGTAYRFADIVHPAAILRANVAQQPLLIQRCVVTLSDAIEEMRS